MIVGVPIAFALAAAGIIGIWSVTGDWNIIMGILGTTPFSSVAEYILTTIPMFILMAFFASSGGLARDLYTAVSNWLAHKRGGLAIATVFACSIFGAMSGSTVASSSVMASIATPNMRRVGYSDEMTAGAIGVGSTLAILIPPSIPMVVYGVVTETSIGRLLIAGVIPGITLGIILSLVIVIWVAIRPSHAPKIQRIPWTERIRSMLLVWPSILLICCVLSLLYTGIVTPCEVGAIGAFLAFVIGILTGRLKWAETLQALKETIRTTAMIFMILIGATIFGYYMTLSQLPQHVVLAVTELNPDRWVVIVSIVIGYFVLSMFMDELPLMLLTLQLTFPLVVSLGFDPIWYGVLTVLMIAMGMVFPPVGIVAFVVSATAKIDLIKVYTGTSILTVALILTTILLMIFPQMALWLPARMR
jgi:tripartite ATP-independent transporter DctM subunit